MRWRPDILCCAAPSATITLFSVVRFCASSPVSRTCPTNYQTPPCRIRSHPARSHLLLSVRLQEVRWIKNCRLEEQWAQRTSLGQYSGSRLHLYVTLVSPMDLPGQHGIEPYPISCFEPDLRRTPYEIFEEAEG